MSMVNPNENLIRIDPPITWDEIKGGPPLSALEMVFQEREAVGIRLAAGGRIDGFLDRQLQKVVDHYADHDFAGHIEVRSDGPGTVAWRIVVRGRHVVRLAAVLGWPPEQVDDIGESEGHLMEILAERGVHIADERYIPADETDLPDVLLAWRDAAVKAALAATAVAAAFPGVPGSRWRDNDADLWIHGNDGQMWMVTEVEEPEEPATLERHAGPMTPEGGK